MDEKVLKAAYEIAYGEVLSNELTPEELERARLLADFLACPNCGE